MIDREGFGPLPWWVWMWEVGCALVLLDFLLVAVGLFTPWLVIAGFGLLLAGIALALVQA